MLAVLGVACTPSGEEAESGAEGGKVEPIAFTIDVAGVTSDRATVSVKGSNNGTYYFDVIEKEVLERYGLFSNFANAIVSKIEDICAERGAAISDFLSSGSDSYEYNLEPNTEYYAYAFGLSSTGEVMAGEELKLFKTLKVGPSLSVSNVTTSSALVSATPLNDNTYYFNVVERSQLDNSKSKSEFALDLLKQVKNIYEAQAKTLADALTTGPKEVMFTGLTANVEYYAIAFEATAECTVETDVTAIPFTAVTSQSKSSVQPQLQSASIGANSVLIKRNLVQ